MVYIVISYQTNWGPLFAYIMLDIYIVCVSRVNLCGCNKESNALYAIYGSGYFIACKFRYNNY
jgi:hypothetical protein